VKLGLNSPGLDTGGEKTAPAKEGAVTVNRSKSGSPAGKGKVSRGRACNCGHQESRRLPVEKVYRGRERMEGVSSKGGSKNTQLRQTQRRISNRD